MPCAKALGNNMVYIIIPYIWYGLYKSIEYYDINNRITNLIITIVLLPVFYMGPIHGYWSTSHGGEVQFVTGATY